MQPSPLKGARSLSTVVEADAIQEVFLPRSQPQKPKIAAKTEPNELMSTTKPNAVIHYRAVHSKTKWRKVNSHLSLESAINGVNGAAGLFTKKVRIDYDKHGEPLFVLVWESEASSGFALRKDPSQTGGVRKISVAIEKLLGFERRGAASESELTELFGS